MSRGILAPWPFWSLIDHFTTSHRPPQVSSLLILGPARPDFFDSQICTHSLDLNSQHDAFHHSYLNEPSPGPTDHCTCQRPDTSLARHLEIQGRDMCISKENHILPATLQPTASGGEASPALGKTIVRIEWGRSHIGSMLFTNSPFCILS